MFRRAVHSTEHRCLFQNTSGPSNGPSRMKRVHQGVQFHQVHNASEGGSSFQNHHQQQHASHELDAKDMRAILTQLFMKTLDMKKKQKAPDPHHHYEGVFKESANIDKPPSFDDTDFIKQELKALREQASEVSTMRSVAAKRVTTERLVSESGKDIMSYFQCIFGWRLY